MQWNVLTNIVIYYCLLTVVVYVLSDFMMFPSPKASYQDQSLNFPKVIKLKTTDGKSISAIYLVNPKAKQTILFSHGNGEDLGSVLGLLEEFQRIGFSVFAYDYHGYGTSEGRTTEEKTYLDIQAAYLYLTQTLKTPAKDIILYGRSIGTGPTIELARKTPVGGVILEAPMVSTFRVITIVPLFPIDKYRNNQKIAAIKAPILFIHGVNDKTIPIWHSQYLYRLAKAPKRFYPVEGADHNNVMMVGGSQYLQAIVSFAASL
jgi:fermentation-respiration switch protein FrsA (DUF1100 family)